MRFRRICGALLAACADIAVLQAAVPMCGAGYGRELVCTNWQSGGAEWPSFDVMPTVVDWRPYDRVSLRVSSEGRGETAFSIYVGGRGKAHQYVSRHLPPCRWQTWTFKIELPTGMDPAHVKELHFFASHPEDAIVRIKDIVLLKKGEREPAADANEDLMFLPPLRRLCREMAEDADRAADELKALKAHTSDFLDFREACARAGQTGDMLLGQATSMERIQPRGKLERPLRPADILSVRLARREYEGVQLVVAARVGRLRDVRVEVGKLQNENGTTFAPENVKCGVTGYVRTHARSPYRVGRDVWENGRYRRIAVVPERGYYPEPILVYTNAADIEEMDLQSYWLRFYADERQERGLYRGLATVCATGLPTQEVPIEVRVNGFALKDELRLPSVIGWAPEYHAPGGNFSEFVRTVDSPRSPVRNWRRHKAEWAEFLADHYIAMDSLYRPPETPPDVETCLRLKARGRLAPVNLGYWKPSRVMRRDEDWKMRLMNALESNYGRLKNAGLEEYAYIYCCDELQEEELPDVRTIVAELKRRLPTVPVATTAFDRKLGVKSPLEQVDWFIPLTQKYDAEAVRASRRAGHRVWWYVCCDPHAPYANMFVDSQAIEARLLQGAMAVRMRPDGFLIYQISIWNAARGISGGPFTDWEPRTFGKTNGDGCWTMADKDGRPLPTIRLENYRDGVEDYIYAKMLEERLSRETEDGAWVKAAREALSVPTFVMESMTNYTDDAAAVYAWRDAMADLLERE